MIECDKYFNYLKR